MTKELRAEIKRKATCHGVFKYIIFVLVFYALLAYSWPYLDLLLHIVKDESLGVYEVVGWVEGDGVQRAAINVSSINLSTTRFGPDQSLNGRHKSLKERKTRMLNIEESHDSH